jgi:hypothetical protein
MQAGEDVLAGGDVRPPVVADVVSLYLGDESVLVVGGDHRAAALAGQAD